MPKCYKSTKRNNCIIFWLQLLLLLTTVYDCHTGKPKFCGKSLNDVLDLVCIHGFVSRIKRRLYKPKKDINNGIHDELLLVLLRASIAENYQKSVHGHSNGRTRRSNSKLKQVMKTPMQRQLQSQRQQRRRRLPRQLGIVHECCRNGCLYLDIVHYCL